MALVKKKSAESAIKQKRYYERDLDGLLKQIEDPDPSERRWAVRDLVNHPSAAPRLCELLKHEDDMRVQDAALDSLRRIGGVEVVRAMAPFLRSDDARLRCGVIEALQAMPDDIAPLMEDLLSDDDSDVRIFAADILRLLPHPKAEQWLCRALKVESHPNVAGAIVDRLTEVGGEACIPHLEAARRRFEDEPYLIFAIDTAIMMSRK